MSRRLTSFSILFKDTIESLVMLTGDGAIGMDPHSAKRVAPAVSTGHHDPRQSDGRQPILGRGENGHHHMQVGDNTGYMSVLGVKGCTRLVFSVYCSLCVQV